MTSATGVPISACFIANVICSSVYLDLLMSQLLARGLQRAGKLSLSSDEKTGGTSGVFNRIFAGLAAEGGPPDQLMIDATHLKAHRTAASLLKKGLFPDISAAPEAA
jgi:hypothetical protein